MPDRPRVASAVCAAVGVAALLGSPSASSLSLPSVSITGPSVTVTTPPVSVKAPTVTVKAPPVPIKPPPIPVKAPPVKIKIPPVPIKVPPPPIKAPTVPAKTPSLPVQPPQGKTVSAKAPGVSSKAPHTVGASTPSVSIKGPSVATQHTSSSSGHATAGARPSSAGPAAPAQGSMSTGAAGSGASGAEGARAAPAPLSSYGRTVGGYGRLPATEGRPGPHARARIAQRERALKAKVARFQGCLPELPETQRELLELRTGLGVTRPLGPRAAAARLDIAFPRFSVLERRAVRELGAAARAHGCRQLGEVVAGVESFIATGFGKGRAIPTGGVEAVTYSAAPTKPAGRRSSAFAGLLGNDIPGVAGQLLLVLALLMGAGLLVGVVLADAAGKGPRHEQWRQRVAQRIRSLR
jgi:hypothetical protein